MRGLKLVLVYLLLVSTALAVDPTLVIRSDGYYLLHADRTDLVKITSVVDQTGGTTPVPPTPPVPPPVDPTPDPFHITVSQWAKEVNDPVGAQVLREAYKVVSDQLANGTIPVNPTALDQTLTRVLDTALDTLDQFDPSVKRKPKWQPFRGKVAQDFSNKLIAGQLTTKAQYVKYFSDVSDGLHVANMSYAAPPWLLELIRDVLIPLLIRLITQIIGGLGANQ